MKAVTLVGIRDKDLQERKKGIKKEWVEEGEIVKDVLVLYGRRRWEVQG